jgi:hypothetical protein
VEILDYGRCFVTFVTNGRGNNARLQVESRCRLTETASGAWEDYLFFASCKSEDTFAARNLFYEENYDFCGIFSDDEYVLYRTRATHTDGFREEGLWKDRFEDVNRHLPVAHATPLKGPSDVVSASLAGIPLVGQVDIASGDGSLKASLEFPIKTMNANDIRNVYQVDTGPVAFPDFGAEAGRHIERMWPAYVAYNTPDFADFVVQHPYPVPSGNAGPKVTVTHYGRLESLPAETRVLAVSS